MDSFCIVKVLTITIIQKLNLMNKNANLVEIFYLADEFCKENSKVMEDIHLNRKIVISE